MSHILGFSICIFMALAPFSLVHARWSGQNLELQKAKAKAYLMKRKKGFDAYQKKLEEMDKRRLAVAFKQKEIRKAYAEKKAKARKKFRRKTEAFPEQAYRQFIRKRALERQEQEKARANYVTIQKELQKVFENKKYRISGKKEFNL